MKLFPIKIIYCWHIFIIKAKKENCCVALKWNLRKLGQLVGVCVCNYLEKHPKVYILVHFLPFKKKDTKSEKNWVLYWLYFVSPELSSVRDYVITHSVRSMCMYVCVCMYVYVCGILQNWSLYPHTLMYCHGTWTQWSLGRVTHVTSTDMGSKVI